MLESKLKMKHFFSKNNLVINSLWLKTNMKICIKNYREYRERKRIKKRKSKDLNYKLNLLIKFFNLAINFLKMIVNLINYTIIWNNYIRKSLKAKEKYYILIKKWVKMNVNFTFKRKKLKISYFNKLIT